MALALAGCGSDGSNAEPATTAAAAGPSPAVTLKALVAAANAGDEAKVRALLVPSSPASLAGEIVEGVGSFPVQTPVIVSVKVDPRFAVAAIAGPRTAEGMKEPYAAYAVALKRVGSGYKASIVSPVEISPLGPDEGSTQPSITQVAAQFSAPTRIVQAGLWLDGKALAADPRGTTNEVHRVRRDAEAEAGLAQRRRVRRGRRLGNRPRLDVPRQVALGLAVRRIRRQERVAVVRPAARTSP